MTQRIVVLGAPGAGKGTQASRISEHFGIPTISTGELFRGHIAAGDALGEEAARYIDEGDLVPDEITIAMLCERLEAPDTAEGFILDGFPRNLSQAAALDRLLEGRPLDAVVEFVVEEEAVVGRLLRRAEIEGRSDDTEEVIRRRLEVYHEQTAPLVDYYLERGLLLQVEAMGEIEEITDRVIAALESPRVP
ncbi:MAG: adenylate kinase [Actinobacteria bacterium]|nr:adenylate kinase [Actinomycetota bacterium]